MILHALIIDDEAPARRQLRRLLEPRHDVRVIAECSSAADAVRRIEASPPDLVFLDVSMPDGSGLSVIDAIGVERMPFVVFVTAHEAHAVTAFDLNAVDYLLKPIEPERLDRALARIHERIEARPSPAPLVPPVNPNGEAWARRLLVTDDERQIFVDTAAVTLVEAARYGSTVFVGANAYRHGAALGELQALLDPREFVRINRSQLVALRHIRAIEPWSHGDAHVVLADGRRLMWSRRYRKQQERDVW